MQTRRVEIIVAIRTENSLNPEGVISEPEIKNLEGFQNLQGLIFTNKLRAKLCETL